MRKRSLAIGLAVALMAPAAADAKPKKNRGKANRFVATTLVSQNIPDAIGSIDGVLVSDITAGNRYRGRKIRDVNVTLQTSGAGTGAAGDLRFRLTAPNGATTNLFSSLSGSSIGPLTLDDESPLELGGLIAPNGFTLAAPYNGVAMPAAPLNVMDNGGVKGRWSLTAIDQVSGGVPSALLFWRLTVTAGRPFQTK